MNSRLRVFTDSKRKVNYQLLQSFYQQCTLDTTYHSQGDSNLGDLIETIDLIVIDFEDIQATKILIQNIRTSNPSISLLIIQSFDSLHKHELLRLAEGYGQLRVLSYREEYPEQLVEYVNALIHPEFPVDAFDIAIVLPVYNEETRFNNVFDFYTKLGTLCKESYQNAIIYFVNDGSKDRTQDLVNQILDHAKENTETVANMSFANAHHLTVNTRKAGTYIEGIKTIRADLLVFVDADDSFRIEDISKMINIVREGYYDMVVGTKDLTAENRPLIRRLMSFVKRQMTRSMLPQGVYDSQTGLKVMSGTAAKYILPHLHMNTGLAIDLEILHIAKKYQFRTLQLPVQCIDQEGSHINVVKDSLQFVKNIYKIKQRNKNLKTDNGKV